MAANHSPIPRFSSPEEEARWWEQHADEAEGTELNENPFAGRVSKVAYSLRLDAADIERLEAAARRRGVYPTQLAREWILERLEEEEEETDPVGRIVALHDQARLAVDALVELVEFADWAVAITTTAEGSKKSDQANALATAIRDSRPPRVLRQSSSGVFVSRSTKASRAVRKVKGKSHQGRKPGKSRR